MASLRGLASTSLFLRHGFFPSRYVPIHRRSLEVFHVAGRASQIRTVFRGALATTNTTDTKKPSQRYSRPINGEIEADIIQLVNQDGQLDLPTRKSNILFSMRPSEQVLVQLDAATSNRPTVCKIMPLTEFRDQERTKEKASRMAKHTAKTSTKQIELNWSIDLHDLSHRLKKISSFIDKGRTVEIVLTKKRGKRMATADDIKQLMDRIRAAIEEANAHQVKPMDGEIGKTLTITIERKN
jgi:translation initiation factor IF-3